MRSEDRNGDDPCGKQRHHLNEIATRCFRRHASCPSVLQHSLHALGAGGKGEKPARKGTCRCSDSSGETTVPTCLPDVRHLYLPNA